MATDISGSHRTVQNNVINALLEAIFDVMDLDGKRSILTFAGLEQWVDQKLPPEGTSAWGEFLRLIDAMRTLLQYSDSILLEVGKKFSMYLDPFGSNFPDFIALLNRSFIDLDIDAKMLGPNDYQIAMQWAGSDSALFTDKWLRFFYQGLFAEGMRKAVGGTINSELKDTNSLRIVLHVYKLK